MRLWCVPGNQSRDRAGKLTFDGGKDMELCNYKYPTCKECICKDCMHNGGICSGCEKCLGTQTTDCPIDLLDDNER